MLRVERDQADPRRFRVEGEVDVSNSEELGAALAQATQEPGDLILDLSGLEFMDSEGMRRLIEAADRLGDQGRLVIERPSSPVAKLLRLVRAETFPNLEIRW